MSSWGSFFVNSDWDLVAVEDTQVPRETAKLESLLSTKAPVFIIGRNDESTALIRRLRVTGMIDQFDSSSWHGIPTVREDEVPPKSFVVNCASSISPESVGKLISERFPFSHHVSYRDFVLAGIEDFPAPSFALLPEDYEANRKVVSWCRKQSASKKDLETFRAIINFGLTGQSSHLRGHRLSAEHHYLHNLLLGQTQTLVDFGGFNGESALALYHFLNQPKDVVVYEPDVDHNPQVARQFRGKRAKLEIRNFAVSDRAARGWLENGGLSSANFEENAEGEIVQVPLGGEVFPAGPAVWKFDIEGAEYDALRSARNLLAHGDVRLAISIYHDPLHLFKIPELVMQLFPEAAIGFGHYSEGWSESVMYVAPSH